MLVSHDNTTAVAMEMSHGLALVLNVALSKRQVYMYIVKDASVDCILTNVAGDYTGSPNLNMLKI